MAQRRIGTVVLAMVLVVGLSGCNVWRQVGHGPERQNWNPSEEGITPANVATLSEQWRSASTWHEPIVDAGKVFVTNFDYRTGEGYATALRTADGTPVWQQTVAGTDVGQAVLMGDELYGTWLTPSHTAICRAGEFRLDSDTGAILAATETTPISYGTAVPVGDRFVQREERFHATGSCEGVVDSQDALVVRDQATGAVLWRSAPVIDLAEMPAVGDGRVYVSHKNGLSAYDLAGCGGASECAPLWTLDPGFGGSVFFTPPLFAEGRVFVGASGGIGQGGVVALDAATGSVLWSGQGGPGDPAYANGLVYVAGSGGIVAFRAAGCGGSACVDWSGITVPPSPYGGHGSVVVAGDVVYVNQYEGNSGTEGGMFAFDAEGCAASSPCDPSWSILPASVDNFSIAEGHLYLTNAAFIQAFAPS